MTDADRPHRLDANPVPVYYRGGPGIARFRGVARVAGAEDWVGSVTPFPPALLPAGAAPDTGISRLADGHSLAEAIAADPSGWLGPKLQAALGHEPGLLVKLLDAGDRLPVHCHPSRQFARAHLGCRFGKAEGWIIIAAEPGAVIWLGFRRPVARARLRGWIATQDSRAMLEALDRVAVAPGDVHYVPPGTPHAIGPGVTLIELQEPTSFSFLAEHRAFGLDGDQATLGLGWERALDCFDRGARRAAPAAADTGEPIQRLFPPEAEPFFQALRARPRGGRLPLGEPGFQVVVVESGSGTLGWRGGQITIRRGQTWVVPHGAGELWGAGQVQVVVCLPPDVTALGAEGSG